MLSVTAGGVPGAVPEPGIHPVTIAVGVPIVGHVGHVSVTGTSRVSSQPGDLIFNVVLPLAGEPGV